MTTSSWLRPPLLAALLCLPLFGGGCASQSETEGMYLAEDANGDVAEGGLGLGQHDQLKVHDPLRTQRAREVYLQGVGLLHAAEPRVEEAMVKLQEALSIDPTFHRAHFKLGIAYYIKGEYELEINEYRLCLATRPKFVPAWLNLGHALLARDELEEARDAYERVLELEPNHAVALYNKALVEFDLGYMDSSEELFERFLRVDGTGEMGSRARSYLVQIEQRRTQGS